MGQTGKTVRVLDEDYVEIVWMAKSEGRTIQGMVHRLVVCGRERRMVRGDTGGEPVVGSGAPARAAMSALQGLRRGSVTPVEREAEHELKIEYEEG
jgi:hypothetical protein